MGGLNTAGAVTFLPDDSPFLECTTISGQAHAVAGRGEGHPSLNPVAPTGKGKSSSLSSFGLLINPGLYNGISSFYIYFLHLHLFISF